MQVNKKPGALERKTLLLLRDYSCVIVVSINKEAEGWAKNWNSLNTVPSKQTVLFSSDDETDNLSGLTD